MKSGVKKYFKNNLIKVLTESKRCLSLYYQTTTAKANHSPLKFRIMTTFDVYKIDNRDNAHFIGVFEANTPFEAMNKAKQIMNIGNFTMRAFVSGSERAIKFAQENK